MSPQRIQRQRTKGWRKPKGAVIVDRSTKWGNPYRVVKDGLGIHVIYLDDGETFYLVEVESMEQGREIAAAEFETYLDQHPELVAAAREELAGRDLCCWCPLGQPCHGDGWIRRIANEFEFKPIPITSFGAHLRPGEINI